MKFLAPTTLFSVLLFSSCLEDGGGKPSKLDYEYVQEERDALHKNLQEAHEDLDEYDLKFEKFEELEAKAKSADEKTKELEELQKEKEKVEKQMRELREEFNAYQKKYEAGVREKSIGEEFATVALKDRTLNAVVIRAMSETEVKVRHADGFATLNSEVVPPEWKECFFLRSEEEVAERAATLAALLTPPVKVVEEPDKRKRRERPATVYQQRRNARLAEMEALKELDGQVAPAMVSVSGSKAQGSGFFVQVGISTYLYTAASLLDDNPGLKVVDGSGREWKDFGSLEVTKGLNLARMEVTAPVEHPLRLRLREEEMEEGMLSGVFTMDEGGEKVIKREMKLGKIDATNYGVSTRVTQGVAGGALVTTKGEVIGLVSFKTPIRKTVWQDLTMDKSKRASRSAIRLDAEYKWNKIALGRFLGARQVMVKFDQVSKLGYAIGSLRATDDGLNLNENIEGGVSIEEILKSHSKLGITRQTMSFHQALLSAGTKSSQRDKNRKLRSLYETAFNDLSKQKLSAEHFSSYHQESLKVSLEFRKKTLDKLQQALSAVKG